MSYSLLVEVMVNYMSLKIKVTPTEKGAVITTNGFDIEIIVKPSETATIEPKAPPLITLESVNKELSSYLDELEIKEEPENIVIMLKRFLEKEKFAFLASLIRELGGSYISAGRESRFIIPKKNDAYIESHNK